MRKIRQRRPSAALVISCIALFVALGGAGYAATQLPKNSVGTPQLKKNAVKSNKIAAKAVKTQDLAAKAVKTNKLGGEAVKAGKLAKNSVTTNRLRDNVVTGAKIDAPSTPFGQIVANLGGNTPVAIPAGELTSYPLNPSTYTQPAGRADQYIGSIDVHFPVSCEAPRGAAAWLLVDAPNPMKPTASDYAGLTQITDETGGDVIKQAVFGPFPGGTGPWRPAPAADTPHTVSVLLAGSSCTSGSGVTATGATINVIGTK